MIGDTFTLGFFLCIQCFNKFALDDLPMLTKVSLLSLYAIICKCILQEKFGAEQR